LLASACGGGSGGTSAAQGPPAPTAQVAKVFALMDVGDSDGVPVAEMSIVGCQNGVLSGARYFEIYKADISSSDAAVQDSIQRARAGQPC